MKRDDTKKNFTPLSGNDLQTVRIHYPSFPCIIAKVPISSLFKLMRYSSVQNAEIHLFCIEYRDFFLKITTTRRLPIYIKMILRQTQCQKAPFEIVAVSHQLSAVS